MRYYLGLDLSTQGLKAVLIDPETGALRPAGAVNFAADLPQFGCVSGYLPHPDNTVRHANVLMWLAATDLLFTRMRDAGLPLSEVKAISGSAQQHGSVYVNALFAPNLAHLDPNAELAGQLAPALSRATAPIWMDASTTADCRRLSAAIGDRLQTDTGSAAIERFTAAQISKFHRTEPEAYRATAQVHLISSFFASLFAGVPAPIDPGDGAGMNLLNLKTGRWDDAIVAATAPGLAAKLPALAAADTVIGGLNPYFLKYGFQPGCETVIWSGDNPSSLVGVGATAAGCAVISLGTSDTLFAAMPEFTTDPAGCGHVFGNPGGGFMSLICFLNGSLTREEWRQRYGVTWAEAGALIAAEPAGCRGNLTLPYLSNEITPMAAAGVRYTGTAAFLAGREPAGCYLRSLFEAQALRMKLHSQWLGEFKRLRLTGGASKDQALVQIIADVFQAPVEKLAITDSAALGAALRAAHAAGDYQWEALYRDFCRAEQVVEPNRAHAAVYAERLQAYARLEAQA